MDNIDKEIEEKLRLFRMLANVFGQDTELLKEKLEDLNKAEEPIFQEKQDQRPVVTENRFSALRAKLNKANESSKVEEATNAEG